MYIESNFILGKDPHESVTVYALMRTERCASRMCHMCKRLHFAVVRERKACLEKWTD